MGSWSLMNKNIDCCSPISTRFLFNIQNSTYIGISETYSHTGWLWWTVRPTILEEPIFCHVPLWELIRNADPVRKSLALCECKRHRCALRYTKNINQYTYLSLPIIIFRKDSCCFLRPFLQGILLLELELVHDAKKTSKCFTSNFSSVIPAQPTPVYSWVTSIPSQHNTAVS